MILKCTDVDRHVCMSEYYAPYVPLRTYTRTLKHMCVEKKIA